VRPNRRQTQGVLWDVIAPWVRWPLHSPRRLFTVVAGLVLAVVLWQVLNGTPPVPESSPSPAAGPATTAQTSSTAEPLPSPTLTPAAATVAPTATTPPAPSAAAAASVTSPLVSPTSTAAPAVPPGSAEAARGFVVAWARPSLPAAQWLAGVRAYLAPELERSLSYTDPAQIPASTVTGAATMVHVLPDGTAASFVVPTDAGPIRVDLVLVKGRWLATAIEPASVTEPGD